MRFLFVCGGTAGHINPALALAEKLRELIPDCDILFVGSGREMEKRLIPAEGYKLNNITITGFSRSLSLNGLKENIKTVRNLSIAKKQSNSILDSFKPDVVIGTGGYVCYPVLKAAAKRKIPTVLHESNAIFGLTTRMLMKIVNEMLVAFPGAKENYKSSNIRVVGTPVRGQFESITKEEARNILGIGDKKLVVSFWGSLGAEYMNRSVTELIARNTEEKRFYQIHATGGGDAGRDKMVSNLKKMGADNFEEVCDVRPYINNMGVVMKAADIVMCRAGASTIAELTLIGAPSVLVPSPYVTNNHQEANARELDNAGASVMVLEKECSGDKLLNIITELLNDEEKLNKMSANAKKLGVSDSAGVIADIILSYIK